VFFVIVAILRFRLDQADKATGLLKQARACAEMIKGVENHLLAFVDKMETFQSYGKLTIDSLDLRDLEFVYFTLFQ
jgi:hypothetical protein